MIKLKNNENSKNLFNFGENQIFFLDSMIHFYDSHNWQTKLNTVTKMISSCLFFNDNNCIYLFKGISRVFYLVLESFLNNESDMNLFADLIEFVTLFYNVLEIKSSITLDELISLFEERSNDQTQFTKFYQNLMVINDKLSAQKDHIPIKEIEEIKPIARKLDICVKI